jgi:hypothetical protein
MFNSRTSVRGGGSAAEGEAEGGAVFELGEAVRGQGELGQAAQC